MLVTLPWPPPKVIQKAKPGQNRRKKGRKMKLKTATWIWQKINSMKKIVTKKTVSKLIQTNGYTIFKLIWFIIVVFESKPEVQTYAVTLMGSCPHSSLVCFFWTIPFNNRLVSSLTMVKGRYRLGINNIKWYEFTKWNRLGMWSVVLRIFWVWQNTPT